MKTRRIVCIAAVLAAIWLLRPTGEKTVSSTQVRSATIAWPGAIGPTPPVVEPRAKPRVRMLPTPRNRPDAPPLGKPLRNQPAWDADVSTTQP